MMGTKTGISWTEHTFNPWIGCQKVSSGCAHCYAEVDNPARVSRGQGLELWGPPGRAKRRLTGVEVWRQPLRWDKAAVLDGRSHRVFCASQSDIFEANTEQMVDHNGNSLWVRPEESMQPLAQDEGRDCLPYTMRHARLRLWQLIESTPRLTWQLLTKRPENILGMVPQHWRENWPRNVWAMTSVENQEAADRRIPELLKVPAMVRGLSVEPLLGPVDLRKVCGLDFRRNLDHSLATGSIDWVIIGGESGPNARPCRVEWIHSLVRQCSDAGVACFVKQIGADVRWAPASGPVGLWPEETHFDYEHRGDDSVHRIRLRDPKGGNPEEWPIDLRVREFPE